MTPDQRTRLMQAALLVGAVTALAGFQLGVVLLRRLLRPWFAAREKRWIERWANRQKLDLRSLEPCEIGNYPDEFYDPESESCPWRIVAINRAGAEVRGYVQVLTRSRVRAIWDS